MIQLLFTTEDSSTRSEKTQECHNPLRACRDNENTRLRASFASVPRMRQPNWPTNGVVPSVKSPIVTFEEDVLLDAGRRGVVLLPIAL